jgi:hypothetical protein
VPPACPYRKGKNQGREGGREGRKEEKKRVSTYVREKSRHPEKWTHKI